MSTINDIIDLFRLLYTDKNIILKSNIIKTDTIKMDKVLFNILLENIISNAIKFNSKKVILEINYYKDKLEIIDN